MSMRNLYRRSIWLTSGLIMSLCAMSTSLFANNLEVADGRIIIKGVGSTSADGKFSFKEGVTVTVTDSIFIDDIVVTYPETKKAPLIILDGNDTIFHAEITKSLTSGEMQKFAPLILNPKHNYKISHGDKSWNVIFSPIAVSPTVNKDSIIQAKAEALGIPAWRIEEGFDISDSANEDEIGDYLGNVQKHIVNNIQKYVNIPWWIYCIIAVLGLSCVCLLLSKWKKGFGHKNNKKDDSKQPKGPEGDNSATSTNESINPGASTQHADDGVNKENALRAKISKLLQNDYDNVLSEDQIIEKIQLLLDTGRKAEEGLCLIRHALNIEDENVAPSILCNKIEELKQNTSTVSPEEKKKIEDEICKGIIDKLLSKNNKVLEAVVTKARDEKGLNQYETILKVVDLLPSKVKDERNSSAGGATQSQSIEITDAQLKAGDNAHILKKWLSENLQEAGITDFDKNKTTLDILNQISERLKKSQEDALRKSDEEIVDGIILDGKLTDEQKKGLIRRLIDIINVKIMDPSKSIGNSLSLDEFAQSIADALQQPNSYEEAQSQTQQRNIAIVNEALGAEMTSLSKDTIKEAVNKAILSLVQSKLSNVSINSYEDALTSLSKYNSQFKELEKLLQDFDVNTLQNLPEAIRKKKNNELLKSVADKVSTLFPGQNMDSVQKLVNALFREVKDAKDSSDKIADNLEVRISSRDKTYTSSEGKRDVLELMRLYDKLVDTEDDKLREQITSKDKKIEQLNDEIANKKETISSLENDNKDLMSESDKLIENLHVRAEKILESWRTILNPCSDDEEAQCVDIEGRLFSDLNSSVTKLKSFYVEKDTIPADTRKAIQDLLVGEISADNSPVNTVCRYYAYSQLPFMTDTAREYGITFNRKNMAELFTAIENLYVQFGINLNIPSLFVMGIEEGEFENVTGKMYGDLDNLCQNSRNHFDNIDSATKPTNVIVDVVNVGYTVDGKVGRITSVLTY